MNPRTVLATALATVAVLVLPGCLGVLADSDPPRDWADGGMGLRLVNAYGDPDSSGRDGWPGGFDTTPALFDINDDGVRDVVGHSQDRNVYVYNGRTGDETARIGTTYPPGWHVERVLNGVAVGTLEPGGPPSLVVTNPAAYVSVWTFDPARSDEDTFTFQRAWEVRLNECTANSAMDAGPVLADLTGDGAQEIVVQTEELGLFALRADGTPLWAHCWGGGHAGAAVDDLDGDGTPDVVFASDAGLVSVFDGASGSPQWQFSARDAGVEPGSVAVAPTVADLDGHPPKEVLFTSRSAEVAPGRELEDNHFAAFAVRDAPGSWEGELVWMARPDWGNPLVQSRLVARDVDADGRTDIFGIDWNTEGHKPGDWQRLGPANLFRLDADGNPVWQRPVDAWWSNKDVAVADLDRDGTSEILVNGPAGDGDGLWTVSALNGAAVGRLSFGSWRMLRGPVVSEAPDGGQHVAVAVESGSGHGAILLYETA